MHPIRAAFAGTLAIALVASASRTARAQTVADVAAQGQCVSMGVRGLSEQLATAQMCLSPGAFVLFAPHSGISLTSADIFPYLSAPARDALWTAAGGLGLQVNSAFRTIADQYVLYYSHACALAATPGASNHETGRAVDLENWSAAIGVMTAAGCTHTYPTTDPVHFDCPGPDMRADSIRAFQHLWNVNNPGDVIAEDGVYGPMTEARLAASPAAGFPIGGTCTPDWGAQFVMQSFPSASDPPITMHVGETLSGFIEMRNIGTHAWDSNTRLGTTMPRDRTSPLAGPDWTNPGRPASVTGTVAMGASYRFMFTLHANAVGSYDEHFGVLEESVAWFSDSGQGGPADNLLEIKVDVLPAVAAADAGADGSTAMTDAGSDDAMRADGSASDAERLPDGALAPGRLTGGCGCAVPGGTSSRGTGARVIAMLALGVVVANRRRKRVRGVVVK